MMIIIEGFKINLIEDGKSTNTVQSYVGDITAFLKYLGTMRVDLTYHIKKLETLQEFYGEAGYFIENSYTELNNLNKKIAGVFDSGFKEIK